MALALPVQGLAGAAMVHCGPNHDKLQGQKVQAPHDSPLQPVADEHAAHHHDTAESAKLSELVKSKRKSCASCCAGGNPNPS